jgi:tRNA threonylcarbamoyladenosine biosynthesis protein TsaE
VTALELQVDTHGPDQTHRLGSALAELARPGDVFLLLGDLGAGKTVLAQGLGAGLGVDDVITSPTFALVQSYVGRLDLHHLDVYRLDQINEALDLGLAELLDDEAVVVIEWGDRIAPVLPQDYLEVRLGYGPQPGDRSVELVPVGSRWAARRRALATVLATFEPGTAAPEGADGETDDDARPGGAAC